MFGEQAVAERHGLASGSDAELAAEGAIQSFELTQRCVTVAVRGMTAHELEVRELVTFVEFDECLPLTVEPE